MTSDLGTNSRVRVITKWLESLDGELAQLIELKNLMSRSRSLAGVKSEGKELLDNLEKQAALCSSLERYREAKDTMLKKLGYRSEELMTIVLGILPREEHPQVIEKFGRVMDESEALQRQIDINREFFSVALATIEDTIMGVAADFNRQNIYNAAGSDVGLAAPLCVSTVT